MPRKERAPEEIITKLPDEALVAGHKGPKRERLYLLWQDPGVWSKPVWEGLALMYENEKQLWSGCTATLRGHDHN
jgi:hypothetical protein